MGCSLPVQRHDRIKLRLHPLATHDATDVERLILKTPPPRYAVLILPDTVVVVSFQISKPIDPTNMVEIDPTRRHGASLGSCLIEGQPTASEG